MQNPVAFDVHYSEYQRQTAWINSEDWKIERTAKQYRVRTAIAQALIHLATLLAPASQETRAA